MRASGASPREFSHPPSSARATAAARSSPTEIYDIIVQERILSRVVGYEHGELPSDFAVSVAEHRPGGETRPHPRTYPRGLSRRSRRATSRRNDVAPEQRFRAAWVPRREHAPREFVEDDERKVPVQDAQVHRVAAWFEGRSRRVSRGFLEARGAEKENGGGSGKSRVPVICRDWYLWRIRARRTRRCRRARRGACPEIHRDVALERDGDSRALDEGEAVRARPEEHLLDVVAMSTRERGVDTMGRGVRRWDAGRRREARKAGVEAKARRLRETVVARDRNEAKRRERNGRVRAASATDARDARQPSDAPGRHPILQRRQLGVHLLFFLCEDGGDDEVVSRKPRALTASLS